MVTDGSLPPEIRIGDAERNAAVEALSAHLASGRLSLAEFDRRSALAVSAVTAGELQPLFADLPAAPGTPGTQVVSPADGPSNGQRIFRTVGAALPILLTLVFAASSWDWWWVYLLLPVYFTVGAAVTRDESRSSGRDLTR